MAKDTEFISHLNLLCDCRHNKTSLYNNKYSETVFFPLSLWEPIIIHLWGGFLCISRKPPSCFDPVKDSEDYTGSKKAHWC